MGRNEIVNNWSWCFKKKSTFFNLFHFEIYRAKSLAIPIGKKLTVADEC